MFDTVLVANRGEIAVRIIATLRRMGIRSIAVYSDVDRDARHVYEADSAFRLGPSPASESYLHQGRLLQAATDSRAQAIHPGYGFLAENASFVRACEQSDLVFIGPSAQSVEIMGDKIRAKLTVAAAGVPVVPGRTAPSMTNDELSSAAIEIGYPVLIKPSAGGGGKGMRLVDSHDGFNDAITSARREALASFGDDTLFLERFVARPRHIEVQVLADSFTNTIHLGERECTLQRRHQKVIEEAPSTLLNVESRGRITSSAIQAAKAVNYRGVGTVEFIVSADAPDEFFFMEMNTRLQVEHPVTEMVTGLDLVEQQILVAAGEPLRLTQDDVHISGHAFEARIYAEDPERGFLPTGGTVLTLREPSASGVRVDSSLREGLVVGSQYDPMLSKIIAHGPDRASALARLCHALGKTVVLGVTTNTDFLQALLALPDVRDGHIDTGLIERKLDQLVFRGPYARTLPVEVAVAFAMGELIQHQGCETPSSRWDLLDGWRLGDPCQTQWLMGTSSGATLRISTTGTPRNALVSVEHLDGTEFVADATVHAVVHSSTTPPGGRMLLEIDDRSYNVVNDARDGVNWIWIDGHSYSLRVQPAVRRRAAASSTDGELRSPMPGSVLELLAAQGEEVAKGTRLVVIEAMKMEHAVVAPFSGVIAEVMVSTGDQVVVDQVLVQIEPLDEVDSPGSLREVEVP